MKNYLIGFFDLEDSEIELKAVVEAGGALLISVGLLFAPLFL